MNSDRITNRITDLLKLAGVSDSQVIEELTDHYLTHIEAEVRRGVNSQKAVRETYQEIANLDPSKFIDQQKQKDRRGLFLFVLIFVGISFYLFQFNNQQQPIENNQNPNKETTYINPPTGTPVAQSNLSVSSEFGFRLHPISNRTSLHKGIDIRAKMGTSVLSTGDGIVIEAGYKPKAGNFITIQHDGNYVTNYYHLSEISVAASDIVREGQIIGKVGNSGLSFSPHLHYEVLKDAIPVNPREYIGP